MRFWGVPVAAGASTPVSTARPDAAPEERSTDDVAITVDVGVLDVLILDEELLLLLELLHVEVLLGVVLVVVGVCDVDEVVGGGDQVDVGVGVGVGVGEGFSFVVVGAGAGAGAGSEPSRKVHEPVRTPTDSGAKNVKRPVDMSRPP